MAAGSLRMCNKMRIVRVSRGRNGGKNENNNAYGYNGSCIIKECVNGEKRRRKAWGFGRKIVAQESAESSALPAHTFTRLFSFLPSLSSV